MMWYGRQSTWKAPDWDLSLHLLCVFRVVAGAHAAQGPREDCRLRRHPHASGCWAAGPLTEGPGVDRRGGDRRTRVWGGGRAGDARGASAGSGSSGRGCVGRRARPATAAPCRRRPVCCTQGASCARRRGPLSTRPRPGAALLPSRRGDGARQAQPPVGLGLDTGGVADPLQVAGDFNTTPGSAAHSMLVKGAVPPNNTVRALGRRRHRRCCSCCCCGCPCRG